MGEVVLAISDCHFPMAHKDHLNFLRELKKRYRPTSVVHLGDELDMHALSNYDHDPDGYGPKDEYDRGMEDMRRLYEVFPKVQACVSNHSSRPFRLAAKCGIPSLYLREYKDFMQAPKGWSWHDKVEIDGTVFIHGEGFSGPLAALKAAHSHMQSTCIGHVHTNAGVLFNANNRHLFFGLNAGCLIDRSAYAFNYGRHLPAKPILGCGIINNRVPFFQPMLLSDKTGRWTGNL